MMGGGKRGGGVNVRVGGLEVEGGGGGGVEWERGGTGRGRGG